MLWYTEVSYNIHDLYNETLGMLSSVLFQLSLTTEWPEDDDFLPSAPPSGTHFTPCSSQQWLEHHGISSETAISRVAGWLHSTDSRMVLELGYCTLSLSWLAGHQLDLYQFLAPNAYPRLEAFVDTIERRVSSQVYEVMPLFEWCDGSHKYLHVDVPLMEEYQVCLCEEIDQSALSKRVCRVDP